MVDYSAIAVAAAEAEDQTQEVSHVDFDNTPEAGVTVGRLISYIELGKQDGGEYQGKKKPDADKVRIEFELLAPKNMIKFERDGKEVEAGQIVSVTLKKSMSDKAKFKKLFNKLQYGREEIKHITQMLGEAFIITIYINEVEKDGKKRKYVNLDKDGEFGISAPFQVDALTGQKTAYQIREHTAPIRAFLFDAPDAISDDDFRAMWDSLFIDGTRELKKQDGTTEQVSKNWLQEAILSAKNFQGSRLHSLLSGVSGAELEAAEAEAAQEPAQADLEAAIAQADAAAAPAKQESAPAAPETPAEPVAQSENPADDVDPLAALGLTTQ